MPYRINARIDEQNHYRCHAPESHYIEELKKRGGLIQLDNIMIDAEQLVRRTFQCDVNWCLRCSGEGAAKKYKGSCCTDLEVDLTGYEIEKMQELGRLAEQNLSFPAHDPVGAIVRRLTGGSFIEKTEKGEMAIDHLPSGRCPLSWMERGVFRCGINTLCLALKLPLSEYKPDPCYIFPLHYVEYKPGAYFLTIVTPETYKWIGADAYVAKLSCLRKPQPGAPPAYAFLKGEIILCLGEKFYAALTRAARPFLECDGMATQSSEYCCGECANSQRRVKPEASAS